MFKSTYTGRSKETKCLTANLAVDGSVGGVHDEDVSGRLDLSDLLLDRVIGLCRQILIKH